MATPKPKNINEYIAGFPPETQVILEKVREAIIRCAPGATEAMAYGLPTFKLNGNLVHFGGFKKHIGFYPAPSAITHFQNEVDAYENAKGSVQFPLNKPIPYKLIERMTKFRVKEQLKKGLSHLLRSFY